MSCKTMSIDLANVPPVPIQIGVAGENSFRTITFDASKWGADYPDATYTVVYRRSDGYLYPVLVNASADAIVWSPTETDTDVSGNGQLEVRLLDGETIGKTIIMQTYVAPSLSGDESEPSTPAPDWVNDVVEDADRAEAALSHYPKIVNGVWFVWNAETGEFVSTGISAQGEDGVSPTVTVTAIEGGHRVTITDASGDHTFDVMDGEDGTGGSSDAVLYTEQTLTPAQKEQARGNIGAGTYSKPSGGIPDSDIASAATWNAKGTYSKPSGGIPKTDLASAVQTSLGKADTALQTAPVTSVNNKTGAVTIPIPTVPQMATDPDMEDWASGKTVDAAALARLFELVGTAISSKANASDIPTAVSELTNDSGYQTATQVQTAIADKADKTEIPTASTSNPIMDGVASAGSNAAYARGDHVHPTDTSRLATTGNAYRTASIPMGHLDATSTATVMTATVDGITELRDGVCMWLRNGVVTSASGFTLNVNGLGAKPCYSSLAAASRSTTIFNVNYTMLLIYNSTRVDGGCWDIVYGVDTNTTYTPPKLGFGYGTCTTAAATAAKTASISSYALNTGGIVSIKFDHDVPAGATLNITSKGAKAMYYRGAAITAGVIEAGDTATFVYSTYYHLIAIDRDEVGGSTITVDDAMSSSSENPVQNKVVQAALDAKADASSIPTVPVQSVNGKTGAVSLNAEDVGAFSETDGAVLESRIDTAISGVTTDSEVQDIRVASDGTVYAAAGTAVRSQFDALNALTVKTESRNLWNPDDPDFGAGVRLWPDGGTGTGNYNTSGYIPVNEGDVLCQSYLGGSTASVVWVAYDASKIMIPNSGATATTYTVPSGASFVRVCIYKTYDKATQIEKDRVTGYEPYFAPITKLDRSDLTAVGEDTNVLGNLTFGFTCYKNKLKETVGGFVTRPIPIPAGVSKIYMKSTTAVGFSAAQYYDENCQIITGSTTNVNLSNGRSLDLLANAKYLQLSGTGWDDSYSGTIQLAFSPDVFVLTGVGIEQTSEPGIGYDAISIFGKREYPSAFINSVAHRGYTQVAPENTLPAFIAARKYGYDRAELDVQWTSNRVPVVLHDGSINETGRNADGTAISGTIDIEDITYQQALSYDFGIWFDQKFAGTKIPTLEEVLTLAKRIGLHLNIELKAESHPTQSDVENVVALVKAHSMEEYVSFHSTATTLLGYVHAAMPDATLAIIVQQITQTQIDSALALKGNNKVYLSSSVYGSSEVALCKSNGIGLSVWTLNTESAITALDPYVSSVTSDKLHAGFVLYKSAMGE